MEVTRYEQTLAGHDGLAAAMAVASAQARATVPASTSHEKAIRDIAAGVAAPVLVGYVIWLLRTAQARRLNRLCFLSRDAQVFSEIALRLAPRLGVQLSMDYVYSSRRTWSLAASDPYELEKADWLFNSFMRSNAADVCARLGLDIDEWTGTLAAAGASLSPSARADDPEQNAALRRFVATPEVAEAMRPRIERMRQLVRDYAIQEGIASESTGLVDAGWTGRMIGALYSVLTSVDLPVPQTFFWGHEPRASGWTDPKLITAYMYNTVAEPGVQWRVPDVPYIVETFCMADHAIVSGYRRTESGRIEAVLENTNAPVSAWGFDVYRAAIYAFCSALSLSHVGEDIRPVLSSLLSDFWITPTEQEAAAWGAYPYDSDPLGRATLPLARALSKQELDPLLNGGGMFDQGDRAWLQGSLALSGPAGRQAAAVLSPQYAKLGSPATD
ncbi:hypothetical protein [Microbispora sp. NPDC049125]|uniref:hypothetical protein n=1 Tax=Microbispora sp. NPDC049125 TaxID=3154929 RepID=UPI0034667468